MRKFFMLAAVSLAVEVAFCAVTAHLAVDCRDVKWVSPEGAELFYDASWYADAEEIRITDNGTIVETGVAGSCSWRSDSGAAGQHILRLEALNNGRVVSAEEAEFACYYIRNETELVIPEGTTEIGDFAFQGGQFTSVTIPNSVTNISLTAFAGCDKIVDVSLGIPQDALGAGFYEAEFTNMQSFDGSRPIVENARQITPRAEMMFADNSSQYTMYAYATRMYLEGGVTYYFSAQYDDKSSIKIDDQMVINPGNDCQRYTGSISFAEGGRHDLELRGWNGGGNGALNYGAEEGLLWWTSRDSTKRGFANYEGRVIFCVGYYGIGQLFPDSYTGVKAITLTGGTTIPDGFCSGCVSLESVSIPNSVTNIGEDAFVGCDKLSRVDIPSVADWLKIDFANEEANPLQTGAKLYVSGAEVSELILPEGTTEIGDFAFVGGLFTSVTIPNSVTNIGENAFSGCEKLLRVNTPSVADWLKIDFANEWANPLKTGAKLYAGGEEVSELEIPEGATEIGDFAFAGGHFTSVTIPNSVTNVSPTAFAGCEKITAVTFENWPDMEYTCHPVISGWSYLGDSVYQTERQAQYSQTLVLKTDVEGPRTLSFRWKATYSGNYLRYYLDGVQKSYVRYSNADWQTVSVEVPDGVHEIKWEYYNGSNYGDYYGWVDVTGMSYAGMPRVDHIFPDSYAGIEQVTIGSGVAEFRTDAFAGCW